MAKNPWEILAEQVWRDLSEGVKESAKPEVRYPPTSMVPSNPVSDSKPASGGIEDLVKRAKEEYNPQILHQIAEYLVSEGA